MDKKRIEELVSQRHDARQAQDWETADRIRDVLESEDIHLADRRDGTTKWFHERKVKRYG